MTFAVAAGAIVAPAQADSVALTVANPSGVAEVVEDLSATFTFAGTVSPSRYLYVKVRPSGGPACAATPLSDSGTYSFFEGSTVIGAFSKQTVDVWRRGAGSFLFCMWLTRNSGELGEVFSTTIAVRPPTGTVALGLSDPAPYPGQTITLSLSGSSEVPRYVFAKYRGAGGAPCAASHATDSGIEFEDGSSVNGSFNFGTDALKLARGTYQVCMWLAESQGDPAPIGGVRSAVFNVASATSTVMATFRSPSARTVTARALVSSSNGVPLGRCLLQSPRGGWKTLASSPVKPNGTCTVTARKNAPGRSAFRVRYVPSFAKWLANTSEAKRIKVKGGGRVILAA